ncbi:hypothetical protein [[Leptolyngbya] sp. PCC 7376]|nr:hypothetical protein [[Leptolyngbya] sp. PCC 7376]
MFLDGLDKLPQPLRLWAKVAWQKEGRSPSYFSVLVVSESIQ